VSKKKCTFGDPKVAAMISRYKSQRGPGGSPFVAFWFFAWRRSYFCRRAMHRVRGVIVSGFRFLFFAVSSVECFSFPWLNLTLPFYSLSLWKHMTGVTVARDGRHPPDSAETMGGGED
jgi:hypothetical protein